MRTPPSPPTHTTPHTLGTANTVGLALSFVSMTSRTSLSPSLSCTSLPTMATARSGTYATRTDADSIEDLSKRLAADLRKNIRALGPYPILSDKWSSMADCLARVANISEMEKELPKEDDATLWECEELALRYVLEDGKLNLCLRLLEEYLSYQQEVQSGRRAVSTEQAATLDKFEQGIGQLLANAWLHVEALQTTDLPLMVRLMTDVLTAAVGDKESTDAYEHRQPACVVRYMFAIGKHLEELGESRVFPDLLRSGTIQLFIRHLAQNHSRLSEADRLQAAQALASLAAAEDFGTNRDKIMADEETVGALMEFDSAFVAEYAADGFENRKAVRPLLDLIAATKRSMSK